MKITKSRLKQIIKEELSRTINEVGDWYSDEYETMADRKYADNPGQEMKDRITKSQVDRGFEASPTGTPSAEATRDPWDGIEANAGMIGDNALKIEYLARQLGIEIPMDPKL